MDLREALGEELFSQVDAKLTEINSADDRKDNPVKFIDLSEGAYVSKENYTRAQTELNGYKQQVKEANATIKSYKDMDIEGIQKSASDWEKKYKEDTKALQDKIDAQERTFAAERYLDGQKIKSPLSRKQILHEFLGQNMEFKDGKFTGADEYMKKVREQYPDDFEPDEPPKEPERKIFTRGTSRTYKPTSNSEEEAYFKKKYGNNKYAK